MKIKSLCLLFVICNSLFTIFTSSNPQVFCNIFFKCQREIFFASFHFFLHPSLIPFYINAASIVRWLAIENVTCMPEEDPKQSRGYGCGCGWVRVTGRGIWISWVATGGALIKLKAHSPLQGIGSAYAHTQQSAQRVCTYYIFFVLFNVCMLRQFDCGRAGVWKSISRWNAPKTLIIFASRHLTDGRDRQGRRTGRAAAGRTSAKTDRYSHTRREGALHSIKFAKRRGLKWHVVRGERLQKAINLFYYLKVKISYISEPL